MEKIVQKYGGASLSTREKIKSVAHRISQQKTLGHQLVVVVSAMGRTIDNLLRQMKEINENPEPREMDVVLSTGEIISAAMLSLALHEVGCKAKSFSGLQAGIHTDDRNANASIKDIDMREIQKALNENYVAVVAGFQGVTETGTTTTLGRGGSDTTAVAIAASIGADRCEILKDVPAIFSANPNIVPEAFPLAHMDYESLLEITFWGAKVLNYRSVEIAKHYAVPLYVGPAHHYENGTTIKEDVMIEAAEILSLSSHETVLRVKSVEKGLAEAFVELQKILGENKIIFPQILHSEKSATGADIYVTAPSEVLSDIQRLGSVACAQELCSVTATCRGTTRPDLVDKVLSLLAGRGISLDSLVISSRSLSVFVDKVHHEKTLNLLHTLVKQTLRPHFVLPGT